MCGLYQPYPQGRLKEPDLGCSNKDLFAVELWVCLGFTMLCFLFVSKCRVTIGCCLSFYWTHFPETLNQGAESWLCKYRELGIYGFITDDVQRNWTMSNYE